MNLSELRKCKYGLTHSGIFHADDVFATAFIELINPDIKIIRSNSVPDDFDGIVYDVGLGEFDHHGSDNEARENGIPYAAFGKLWRKFAKDVYGEYVSKKIDRCLIESLDLSDNTGKSDSLCLAIAAFNPIGNDSNGDKKFREAVFLAKTILEKLIKKEQTFFEEEKLVKEIYDKAVNKEIIVLDRYLHFKDTLPGTDAVYVVHPSNREGYVAQAVTINSETRELKKPFPKKWLTELPSYLTFCHKSGFLIAGLTLEDVIHACNIALKGDKNDR